MFFDSKLRKALFTSVSVGAMMIGSHALGNPNGANVVVGDVNIGGVGTDHVIIDNNSDRAIVDWNDFSIGLGETTTINQVTNDAAILNRVTGGNVTEIYGTLESNGQVFLINESGILIGASGVVETNGFVASTLDVSNSDFLGAGDMLFSQGVDAGGGIEVHGKIRSISGGDIFLLSREITIHEGAEIKSEGGYVGLGAGDEYALAINNTGVVRARTVSKKGGRIRLGGGGKIRNTGRIVARKKVVIRSKRKIINKGVVKATDGNRGGQIVFDAPEIAVETGSLIDVSGALGGGRAFIGGGYQGQNQGRNGEIVDIENNSQNTVIEFGAVITADATDSE